MPFGSATVGEEDEAALMVKECEVLRGRWGRVEEERRERDGFGGVRVAFDDSLGLEVVERRLCSLRESAILESVYVTVRERRRRRSRGMEDLFSDCMLPDD